MRSWFGARGLGPSVALAAALAGISMGACGNSGSTHIDFGGGGGSDKGTTGPVTGTLGGGGQAPLFTGSFGSDDGGGGAPECGRLNFSVARKPSDVLLVLDRSASMDDDPSGGSGTPSKWTIIIPPLEQVVTNTDAVLNWGLKYFPEGDKAGQCTTASFPGSIAVPVAPSNKAQMLASITAANDKGDGTPTGDAINKAVEYLQTLNDGNPKYILLATDGEPSCPKDNALAQAVAAVTAAAQAGIHTFVIGVASAQSKVANLNSLAAAGLEPAPAPDGGVDAGAPKFYLAGTQADLSAALSGIAGLAATCVFPLSDAPPAPDHVAVLVDGTKIDRDTTSANGWNYTGADSKEITLFGAACDQARAKGAASVDVIFGCKDDPLY